MFTWLNIFCKNNKINESKVGLKFQVANYFMNSNRTFIF